MCLGNKTSFVFHENLPVTTAVNIPNFVTSLWGLASSQNEFCSCPKLKPQHSTSVGLWAKQRYLPNSELAKIFT